MVFANAYDLKVTTIFQYNILLHTGYYGSAKIRKYVARDTMQYFKYMIVKNLLTKKTV